MRRRQSASQEERAAAAAAAVSSAHTCLLRPGVSFGPLPDCVPIAGFFRRATNAYALSPTTHFLFFDPAAGRWSGVKYSSGRTSAAAQLSIFLASAATASTGILRRSDAAAAVMLFNDSRCAFGKESRERLTRFRASSRTATDALCPLITRDDDEANFSAKKRISVASVCNKK